MRWLLCLVLLVGCNSPAVDEDEAKLWIENHEERAKFYDSQGQAQEAQIHRNRSQIWKNLSASEFDAHEATQSILSFMNKEREVYKELTDFREEELTKIFNKALVQLPSAERFQYQEAFDRKIKEWRASQE